MICRIRVLGMMEGVLCKLEPSGELNMVETLEQHILFTVI